MTNYKKAIIYEMKELAKLPKTIFLGQQVASENFYNTLTGISMKKRWEMPVAEDMQTGIAIGLALEGYLPVSIYQRMDFLPRACDQLVNHLDIIKELSQGKYNPKVIIRTTVGSTTPFDVGLQHNKDLVKGFKNLFRNILVVPVKTVKQVHEAYLHARCDKEPTMIIEYQDLY